MTMLNAGAVTFTSPGNITVSGASGNLTIGSATIASGLLMSGSSILTLNNASGQLNVFGNLEMGATASLSNTGVITIGQ
jgi:hypothetical protein